jgi:hypothetical protein
MNPDVHETHHAAPAPSRLVLRIGLCVFLVAIGFFLWTEHRAHLLGALPYLLLLACPAMHLFMHHRTGHRDTAHEHGADQ